MKRMRCFLLTIVMLLSFCTINGTSFAADVKPLIAEFPEYGFQYVYPEAYMKAEGLLRWIVFSESQIDLCYIFPIEEGLEEAKNREFWEEIQNTPIIPFDQIIEHDGFDFFQMFDVSPEKWTAEQTAKYIQDNKTYYSSNFGALVSKTSGCFTLDYSGMPEYWVKNEFQTYVESGLIEKEFAVECEKEYYKLRKDTETFVSGFQLLGEDADEFTFLPASGLALTPEEKSSFEKIVFETTDLEGNPISSKEILADHKLTMINIWATWCGPCVNEIPRLDELNQYFEGQGCQVIGICDDAALGATAQALNIVTNAGASYLNLASPANIKALFPCESVPTSFFVDSEGNVLVRPIVQNSSFNYERGFEAALAALGE